MWKIRAYINFLARSLEVLVDFHFIPNDLCEYSRSDEKENLNESE